MWYFDGGGQTWGPLSWDELRGLAARGRLRPTDLLWRKDEPADLAARQLPVVFLRPIPLTPAAATVPGPPPAGAPLEGLRALSLSRITLGDFQILRTLGTGAMGTVYLSRQLSADRFAALKVLSTHLASDAGYVRRFYREAELLDRLDHPGLVRLYGAGEEQGLHYFAMEYVDGFTLMRILDRQGGRLKVGDALHVLLACARALQCAHEHQIVHRDVKPSNILISRLGHVKLTDLGLAKPLGGDASLTDSGVCMGTPQYMAPEQSRSAKHADARSDIYALGGVLYRMLTGQLPFRAEAAIELLLAKEQGLFLSTRRLNDTVPPKLDLIIDKMLARSPQRRHQSCAEVIRDLEALGLASAHLGFNPLHAPAEIPGPHERVEVLLIHDDPEDVLLAREALLEGGIPSNLTVARDGCQALALLSRQGQYAGAARPHLIVLGCDLLGRGGLETVAAIKAREELRAIPLVVLSTSEQAANILLAHGLPVSLKITALADLGRLQDLIAQPVQVDTLTVVQLPRSDQEPLRGNVPA